VLQGRAKALRAANIIADQEDKARKQEGGGASCVFDFVFGYCCVLSESTCGVAVVATCACVFLRVCSWLVSWLPYLACFHVHLHPNCLAALQ
jgi:hypothetical protein